MATTHSRPSPSSFGGGPSDSPSSSSTFRSALFSSPEDELKQNAFRALKPHCTSLLTASPLTPQTLPIALTSLHHINLILTTLSAPAEALTQSLVSYIFFPITQLLQRNPPTSLPPSIREGILNVLAVLVRHWHGDGRMGVREQVWKMMIGWWKVGGLAEKEEGVKAWVACLDSIVRLPVPDESAEEEVDIAGLEADGTEKKAGLQVEMKELVQRDSFLPVLGETLSLLIGICQSSHSPLKPLLLLRYMLDHYLLDSPRMLATILPGAVSTMCKVVSPQVSTRGGRGVQGEVVKEALGVLKDVVVGCFNRDVVGSIAEAGAGPSMRGGLGTLEELNDWVEDEQGAGWRRSKRSDEASSGDRSPLSTATSIPPSPTPSSTSFSTSSTRVNAPPSPLVKLSESWLLASASQMLPALVSLSHLKRHSNPTARQALAELASTLLRECLLPLESSIQVLVGFLLTLSVDDFFSVHRQATSALETLLHDPSTWPILLPIIKTHLTNSLSSLPLLLQKPHQASAQKILDLSLQITAVSLLPSSSSLLQGLLGPLGGVQRWGSGLLDCLEFERSSIDGEGADGGMKRVADLAWQGVESADGTGPSSPIPDGLETAFPRLDLRNIPDPQTAKAFEHMLVSLGRAGGVDALFSVEHFISVARASSARATRRGVAAIWCAGRILEGVTSAVQAEEGAEEGGKIGPKGKKLRKTVRGIVRSLVEMDDQEDEEVVHTGPEPTPEDTPSSSTAVTNPADSRLPTEYSKGYNALTTLLDRPLATSSSSTKPSAPRSLPHQSQKPLLTCLSLTLLSQASSILSTSFRPLLLSSLYFLLSHLGSPSHQVRAFASVALARVAYHTGYASVQNLVMDNVDYVINVVSQRLTSERLSPAAPLVLISMIRLVGEPIVPLVHDIVDEVFDALDDFHGYETVASTLLAVLDTLMKVMANEPTTATTAGEEEEAPEPGPSRSPRDQPRPKKDLQDFKHWFLHRHEAAQAEIDDLLSTPVPEPTPQHPWGATDQPPGSENLEADPSNPSPGTLPPQDPGNESSPPTRSQTVCLQILSKALFFLTHASPFIRARVLSLLASGIQVLGPEGRERELLPVVNKAWPFVLNRMSGGKRGERVEEPYVVLEAARVVEALATHVGEYMGHRVRDEGWPKLRQLLSAQMEGDKKASLSSRRPAAGASAGSNPLDVLPIRSTHSTAHKLYLSILSTLLHVAQETEMPWKTRWEVVVAVRPFLWDGVEGALGQRAREVLEALGRKDGDMVWSALSGTVGFEGEAEGERMGWMEEKGWGIEEGVAEVLRDLAGRKE